MLVEGRDQPPEQDKHCGDGHGDEQRPAGCGTVQAALPGLRVLTGRRRVPCRYLHGSSLRKKIASRKCTTRRCKPLYFSCPVLAVDSSPPNSGRVAMRANICSHPPRSRTLRVMLSERDA